MLGRDVAIVDLAVVETVRLDVVEVVGLALEELGQLAVLA